MRRRYETALKQFPVADTKALSETKKGKDAKKDNTGYLRDFAYRSAALTAGAEATLLWNPALFSADGAAQEPFFLPHNLTTYRVLIYAHSPDGRLGFFEGHLDVRPASGK